MTTIDKVLSTLTESCRSINVCLLYTSVVDALRMLDEFDGGNDLLKKNLEEDDIENLLIEQIEFCNMILLNKASEVSPADREKLHQIIRGLQPKAEIIDCDYGDVDLDKIINTNMFDFNSVATSATWISEIEKHHDEAVSYTHLDVYKRQSPKRATPSRLIFLKSKSRKKVPLLATSALARL